MRGSGLRRSIAFVMALCTIAALAATLPASGAAALLRRSYWSFAGSTTGGDQVAFGLSRGSSGVLRLEGWNIEPALTCDDGTTVTDHGFGWGTYPAPRLDGRHLDITVNGFDARYRIVGRFMDHGATGWLRLRVATLDATGNAQVCRTGRLDWAATRGGASMFADCPREYRASSGLGAIAATARTTCSSTLDGRGLRSNGSSTSSPTPTLPSAVLFKGHVVQSDLPVQFILTITSPSGSWLLLGAWEQPAMQCGDGSAVTNRIYGFGDDPPPQLDGRRLDHIGLYLAQRTREVGTFRNHHAEGWMTFRTAAFDATGTPQICRTGRVDWVARR